MAISQEDMNKERHLTGDMQRAGCRTVVFYQQNKGSVWLNLLNWSEPQKKNNDYYDMVLGALLWLTIPLKTIIKLTCVGPDGLMWAKNELRSSINHESRVLTSTNNGKVTCGLSLLLVLAFIPSCFLESICEMHLTRKTFTVIETQLRCLTTRSWIQNLNVEWINLIIHLKIVHVKDIVIKTPLCGQMSLLIFPDVGWWTPVSRNRRIAPSHFNLSFA